MKTQRLNRVIWLQLIAMVLNLIAMSYASWSMLEWMFPGVEWFWLLGPAIITTYVGVKWLNLVTAILINLFVYRTDTEECAQDLDMASEPAPAASPLQVNLNIVGKPEKPIAKFMDNDIYEWLDVAGQDQVVHRLTFEGTVNLENGSVWHIPDNCLMIPPGILYRLQSSL